VPTPAEVIGSNVRALRESLMTAEEFGRRIGEILGKPWPRQMVYLMEKGGRSCTAEDVIAMAMVLDVPIADLFIPSTSVTEVEVGQQQVPRERLLTQGQSDSERLYGMARHIQALDRSTADLHQAVRAQRLVMNNIDRASQGKPPMEARSMPDKTGGPQFHVQPIWTVTPKDYARMESWYAPAAGENK
jgi:hypothetical protein